MHRSGSLVRRVGFGDKQVAPNAGSNSRIHPDATPPSRVVHRLLVVKEVVECGERVWGMARFLADTVRRMQATLCWPGACCKSNTAMGHCCVSGYDDFPLHYRSSLPRFDM